MDKKELQVKMIFYIMGKSLEEIAKVDEEFKEDMEDIEGTIQWKIGDIRGYQVFDEGNYSFVMDEEAEDPDAVMILEDLDFAQQFFSGEVDGTSAYMSGDLKIEGNLQLIMNYGSLAEYIADYLAPIRPE
jgi:putative sterol carrier protein